MFSLIKGEKSNNPLHVPLVFIFKKSETKKRPNGSIEWRERQQKRKKVKELVPKQSKQSVEAVENATNLVAEEETHKDKGLLLFWRSLVGAFISVICSGVVSNAWNSYFVRLYVIVMPRTRFSVNLHSIVAWMSRNSLLEAGEKSEG